MTDTSKNSSKKALYIVIGAVFLASIAYRIIESHHFEQTSLLFVGLPTLIALLIVRYSDRPKSLYGIAFKAITLFLLVASIALGEGIICIVMAAPLFYGVTALLVFAYKMMNKDEEQENILHVSFLIPLALVLGQVTEFNQAPVIETITSTKEISNTSLETLNSQPDLEIDLPFFFQIGFPRPLSIEGDGLSVGDQREIKFESSTKGIGSLVLEITEATDNGLVFNVVSDDTHIAHWMTWKKIEVNIETLDATTSNISWTSHYTCDLGPSWYFGTWERYAVDLSNEHLINAFFEGK